MGLLGSGTPEDTKQLGTGDDVAPQSTEAEAPSSTEEDAGAGSLSAEDLKELEDLDLSGVDMEELKSELQDLERQMADVEGGDEVSK